jgi:mannose/fructose/N-acetylgalactosamine-specific phosphotransferase system component IID
MAVGDPLSGEEVRAVIEPPLAAKTAMPGYGFLWWFILWPVFAVLLACYGGYLAWQTWGAEADAA